MTHDGRLVRRFIMEPETWLDINTATTNVLGMPFDQLADQHPTTAYGAFRVAFLKIVDRQAMHIGEDPEGRSYQAAAARLPEVVEEPTVIQVDLFDTIGETGEGLPRDTNRPASTILSFTVDPPIDLFSG